MTLHFLTINTGSSSLKAGLYDATSEHDVRQDVWAIAERIGQADSRLRIGRQADGTTAFDWEGALADHAAALQMLLDWLRQNHQSTTLDAIGHRVVYGGKRYREPHVITDGLLADLQVLVPVDPDHLPQALSVIQLLTRAYPAIPQVACFDTAFHRGMPRVAQMYALPRRLVDDGVIRYGFHGLSYEYIVRQLRRLDPASGGRLIVAHLGNGASMAAIRDGSSLDTTMGFTPTGGLVMGTRSGDLDPGVLLYLLQSQGMTANALSHLVNRDAGLLGVSETSADMQDLLSRENTDLRAAEAIDLFCYQARKFVGALAAVLGGLDTLVFTGGIGEHAAPIRARICAGLEFLDIALDGERNARQAPIISRDGSPVLVRVIKTDEDIMIATHTYRLFAAKGGDHVSV